MPLTPFQTDLARRLAEGRSPDSYLAGGAALHLAPESRRYSNDLDYFHDSEERVSSAFASDRVRLEEAGYTLHIDIQLPGYIRAIVERGEDSTKVEWAHDSAWRFLPVVEDPVVGYRLHPIDLAVNKLLALVGRDEPRDFLDVVDVIDQTLPLGPLCWAAAGKDPGYTPFLLLELLRRRGKVRPEDFARLHLTRPVDVPALKVKWLAALDAAETFVRTRPPEELGCLYYSAASQSFVDPTSVTDAVPHFGRPGGLLPSLRP